MSKRDPELTARNKIIKKLTLELKAILPEVLNKTGFDSEASLHGKIGGKFAEYIDIQNAIIVSPEHFISLWVEGYQKKLDNLGYFSSLTSNANKTFQLLKEHEIFKEYLFIFLKRVYLRNYDSLSKKKPKVEDAEIWFGQNKANYGLMVTPRFKNGAWENDKSEIRHFKKLYWSISHVLETGLLIPHKNEKMEFEDINDYLNFFKNVLVRNSGSTYEMKIAELYIEFVLSSENPENIPLLIPEFRYDGIATKHMYRLDFTIIEPIEFNKIGFELSPWSSHGYLSKIGGLTQKEINEMAQNNFEKEMRKHKEFFKKHGIFTLIYTDSELQDIGSIFEDFKKYLLPKETNNQLKLHIINDFFN